jgi:hypothetical protein
MATKEEKPKTEKPLETEMRAPGAAVPKPASIAGAEPQPSEATARPEIAGPIGLEQIREILFGALFRELERRLARADVHTSTRSKEIEQEARRRTEVLEGHLRTEIGALASRVENAFVEAADALRSVARENRDAISALEKRVAKAEEAGAGAQRELRKQMLEQAKSFLDELQHLRTELLATLQQELGASEGELAEERGGTEERPRH